MRRTRGKSSGGRTKYVGIIAEDDSDVSVLKLFIGKIAKSPFSVRHFAAGGCGKILGKCRAWAQNLKEQGCSYLLLVHDLDRANLNQLQNALAAALGTSPINPHAIIIPIREIEAWLLADEKAINKVMKLKRKLPKVANPEALQNPKERLADLVYTHSQHSTRYVNTIHNPKIAAECDTANLQRCNSFRSFQAFIAKYISP